MSFLSALFGGHRGAAAAAEKPAEPVEYKGFVIRAAPFKNEGQYQTAGTIEREIAGALKEHRFVRRRLRDIRRRRDLHARQGAADD